MGRVHLCSYMYQRNIFGQLDSIFFDGASPPLCSAACNSQSNCRLRVLSNFRYHDVRSENDNSQVARLTLGRRHAVAQRHLAKEVSA